MIGLPPVADAGELPATAQRLFAAGTPLVAMSGPPLMHGTGCWLGMMVPHLFGGTAVLLEGRGLDAGELWDAVEREGVQHLIVVGDAFAKPLLRALDDAARSVGPLEPAPDGLVGRDVLRRGEAAACIGHVPALAIADVLGSTEGGMGTSVTTKDTPATETAKFSLNATTKVFIDDGSRGRRPGSGEIGMVANGGHGADRLLQGSREVGAHVPRGRTACATRSPATWPRSRPTARSCCSAGDRTASTPAARRCSPRRSRRRSRCHPAVEDALVFGVPDDRFGQRVVGVVSLEPGRAATADDVLADARDRLSSYKLPKALRIVATVPARAERQGRLQGGAGAVRTSLTGRSMGGEDEPMHDDHDTRRSVAEAFDQLGEGEWVRMDSGRHVRAFSFELHRRWLRRLCDLPATWHGSFDAVVAYGGVLSYVFDDAETAVTECLETLTDGGVFVGSVMSLGGNARLHIRSILELAGNGHLAAVDQLLRTGDQRAIGATGVAGFQHFTSTRLRTVIESAGGTLREASASNWLDCPMARHRSPPPSHRARTGTGAWTPRERICRHPAPVDRRIPASSSPQTDDHLARQR